MDLEHFKTDIIPLRPKLFLMALKMMENEVEAEDIVQESLLKLWSRRDELDAVGNPAGFAMQTTKNICIDKLRARRQTLEVEGQFIEDYEVSPYIHTEQNDSVSIIKRIIEHLPELQRRIIRMRDIEGYELNEIAEITGTNTSAVTVNLSRARKKVRDEFIKYNNYIHHTIKQGQ